MKTVSVTAHFDGERIRLDEPLDLEPNAKLMVTVLSPLSPTPEGEVERSAWQQLSARGLAAAYAEDEEDFDLSDVKVSNPAYERG